MMAPAQRYREFVADFAAESLILRKAQMVGVARLTAADQAGLPSDKTHMVAIANAPGFRMHQDGFVYRC